MELQTVIQQIDRLKAEIDRFRPISAEQEQRIMQKFRLDWTYHSNAIEGNSLTYGETRALLLYGVTAKGKPLKDALDIKGHHEALDYLAAFVQQKQALTQSHIRELHKTILSEPYEMEARTEDGRLTKRRITPGQYKTMSNHVVTQTGATHFYASPEETPARMADLMDWYRHERKDLHPLLLAATFHYKFVAIHPFDDGNGRMARLLMNLILMQAGHPPVVVRIDGRSDYYLALAQADAGELDNFLLLIGNYLIHSLDLFLRGVKGEHISELTDLDKKLTLLQQKLETHPDKQTIKSSITLAKWNKDFFQPFITSLVEHLNKFDTFFATKNYKMAYRDGNGSSSYENIDLKEFFDDFHKILNQGNISKVFVVHKWELFVADSDFSLKSSIVIHLKRKQFTVTQLIKPLTGNQSDGSIPSKLKLEKTLSTRGYDSAYPNELVNNLVESIADSIFTIINTKTDRLA